MVGDAAPGARHTSCRRQTNKLWYIALREKGVKGNNGSTEAKDPPDPWITGTRPWTLGHQNWTPRNRTFGYMYFHFWFCICVWEIISYLFRANHWSSKYMHCIRKEAVVFFVMDKEDIRKNRIFKELDDVRHISIDFSIYKIPHALKWRLRHTYAGTDRFFYSYNWYIGLFEELTNSNVSFCILILISHSQTRVYRERKDKQEPKQRHSIITSS